jgi:hypothetical protein
MIEEHVSILSPALTHPLTAGTIRPLYRDPVNHNPVGSAEGHYRPFVCGQ